MTSTPSEKEDNTMAAALKKLDELVTYGIITGEEYQQKKKLIEEQQANGGGVTSAPNTTSSSVEATSSQNEQDEESERALKKLDELLENGFITNEEYERRKADITVTENAPYDETSSSSWPVRDEYRGRDSERDDRGEKQRPGDWFCEGCGAMNFAFRGSCFKCNAPARGGGSSSRQDSWQPYDSQEGRGGRGGSNAGPEKQRPGDWFCDSCNVMNFSFRGSCFKCNAPSPVGGSSRQSSGGDWGERSGAEKQGRPGDWICRDCNANNFAFRASCFKCSAPAPSSSSSGSSRQAPHSSSSWPPYESSRREGRDSRGGGEWGGGESRGAPSVRPGDWECQSCGVNNYAFREGCFKCGAPPPRQGKRMAPSSFSEPEPKRGPYGAPSHRYEQPTQSYKEEWGNGSQQQYGSQQPYGGPQQPYGGAHPYGGMQPYGGAQQQYGGQAESFPPQQQYNSRYGNEQQPPQQGGYYQQQQQSQPQPQGSAQSYPPQVGGPPQGNW